MATTLTSSYKYMGRSNPVPCPNGYNYYILLYAKTSKNSSTGKHTITAKQILACDSDSSFHNWNTTGYVRVYEGSSYETIFSWNTEKVPLSSWGSNSSLTVGSTTYKRHTVLKEASLEYDTDFAEKTVELRSLWRMEDSNSAGWFPAKTEARIEEEVVLTAIATASKPSLSASSVQMGNKLKITTNRSSSALTHKLYYTFGGTKTLFASGVGASYEWTVPDLAAKCNNKTSGTCTITCETYSGSTKIGTATASVTLTVPAATTPTFSASSVNMGSSVTIYTSRKSSNFTHELTYSFGGSTVTIASSGVTTSKAWTPSIDLAKKIKTATSGTATVTCTTYNGTAVVGTPKTASIELKVPNNETTRPKITTVTLSPSPSLGSAFDGLYIQGRSGVQAVITAESEYSDVMTYTVKASGATATDDTNIVTLGALGTAGEVAVQCEVVDARGYSSKVTKSINVEAYSKPSVAPINGDTAVVCTRCLMDGKPDSLGAYLLIKAQRQYTPLIINGQQKNFCSLVYRHKTATAESMPQQWAMLIAKDSLVTDIFSNRVSGLDLDIKTSYRVEIGVIDDISGEDGLVPLPYDIPTAGVDFNLNNGKGAFGRYAEKEGTLEVDWNLDVNKEMSVGDLHIDPKEKSITGGFSFDGTAAKATALTSTLHHSTVSVTPTEYGTGASPTVAGSFELEPGTYLYIIEVTWSKVNTTTKLLIRNTKSPVPSKNYGNFPTSSLIPGMQSVDVFTLTEKTTVSTQIWPEDSTSLKAYTVHTKIIKLC